MLSPFGKELTSRLTLCSLCLRSICNFSYFLSWFCEMILIAISPVPGHCALVAFRLEDSQDLRLSFFFWGGGVSWDRSSFVCCLVYRDSANDLHFVTDFQWYCLAVQGSPTVTLHVASVESSFLLLHSMKACFIC